jgi:hypothetical protein
LNFNSVE